LTTNEIRRYAPERYSLRRTKHKHTPKGEIKPNPRVLLAIIKDIGGTPEETVYVGDNLIKDVLMAQPASVADVWAKYGDAKDRPQYELLRRVTHWRASDVEREKVVKPADVKPSYILENSFSEILERFEFVPFIDKSPDRLSMALDIWKKTIDVQQHFNDLELRIRNYAVTVLAALFGVTAFAFKEHLELSLIGIYTSAAVGVLLAGVIGWSAFYFMDRLWYHRLLQGAVDHGVSIEKRIQKVLPEIPLTDSIGRASPLSLFGLKIHSKHKIDIFYGLGLCLLLSMILFAHFSTRPSQKVTEASRSKVSQPDKGQVSETQPRRDEMSAGEKTATPSASRTGRIAPSRQ